MENKSICHEVKVLSNLIRRKTFDNDCLKEIGPILGSQGYIIKYLSENQNCDIFQKDIEKKFKIRRSTVTSALNRMEKGGLVVRQSVERDSRLKKISLTEKGLSLHNYIESQFKSIENNLKAVLSNEEIDNFYNIIKKLQAVVE
jgi:DNA-binding MarR family transcriptional regulator